MRRMGDLHHVVVEISVGKPITNFSKTLLRPFAGHDFSQPHTHRIAVREEFDHI